MALAVPVASAQDVCTGNCPGDACGTEQCTGECGSGDCQATAAITAIEVVEATPAVETDGEGQVSKIARRMTQAEKAENARVNDSWGGAITIIAMCIVVSALAILSILFYIFGRVSKAAMSRKKQQSAPAGTAAPATGADGVDNGEAIAAIAMALSEHFGDGHDMEDTILTIRKLQRAYSPWNSKLYNLRQTPELHRNGDR